MACGAASARKRSGVVAPSGSCKTYAATHAANAPDVIIHGNLLLMETRSSLDRVINKQPPVRMEK
jgi:hypothetical protein